MTGQEQTFTLRELRRVGTAATMLVVCGTVIILVMTMAMGHYNSLAHSGPKAVLDGAVIALLIGRQGRWRCLALLGVVYGLVLLLQVGVFYLLPVMALSGAAAALAGRSVQPLHRVAALFIAAVTYEVLAGSGAPIKIYFGTGGRSEPFVWGLWFAEFPLRIGGAMIGVWLAGRWLARRELRPEPASATRVVSSLPQTSRLPQTQCISDAAVRLTACIIACTLPMVLQSYLWLSVVAVCYIAFALWAGLRWGILHIILGLVWGWVIFGLLSYAWHHDMRLVLDLSRTLVLRFAPASLAAAVLVATVRPIDLVRLLRRLRFSHAILLPLASVVRGIPRSRLAMRNAIDSLRSQGHWTGPVSVLRHPVLVGRALMGLQVKQWVADLAEEGLPSSK